MTWSNKYGSGAVRPGEALRMPSGTLCFYEAKSQKAAHGLQSFIHGFNTNQRGARAKISTRVLYAFDIAGKPYYLIRLEVIEPGRPYERKRSK